jgi:hypothetical protein
MVPDNEAEHPVRCRCRFLLGRTNEDQAFDLLGSYVVSRTLERVPDGLFPVN